MSARINTKKQEEKTSLLVHLFFILFGLICILPL